MNQLITTKSIAKGIAEAEFIVLEEKPLSRLVFKATIVDNGVKKGIRGFLIRQKRCHNSECWKDEQAIKLKDLDEGFEGVKFEIPMDGVHKLFQGIKQLTTLLSQKGVEYGEKHYAVVDPKDVIITDENKKLYIKKILDAGHGEKIWENIVELNPDLATKLSHARVQIQRQIVLDELKVRLNEVYSETVGFDSWQKWISQNNWLLGVNYRKPIEKAKINLSGIMPDFLYPTIDGFVDVLEIKLPGDEVLIEDKSHKGAWKWSSETNIAIGQVVNYLTEIDRLRFENENNIETETKSKILFLKPRAFILIGNSENWSKQKIEAFRKLNYYLHNIEVITYKELLDRGKQFINTDVLTN